MSTVQYYQPGQIINGSTYAEWTQKWWMYFLGNPFVPVYKDPGGVYFFASEFVTESPPPQYNLTPNPITPNTPCLIPIVNQCSTPVSMGGPANDQQLNDDCNGIINSARGPVATLTFPDRTTTVLESQRVHTLAFPVTYGGGRTGGTSRGVADGHWIFLKGLPANSNPYIIKLAGMIRNEFNPNDFLDVTGVVFIINVT